MSGALHQMQFDDDKDAAGKVLDALRLRFVRAGFHCHKRPAKDMTVKAYLAQGVKRPLINPRLGTIVKRNKVETTCELDFVVFPDDLTALGRLLRPLAKRHNLTYVRLPDSGTRWPAGVLSTTLRVRLDGQIDTADGPPLDQLLSELHSTLTPSGLETAHAR